MRQGNAFTNAHCDRCAEQHPGRHVVFVCANHPNKEWTTKNIPFRSLFYNLFDKPGMGPECECSGADLVHSCERTDEQTKAHP